MVLGWHRTSAVTPHLHVIRPAGVLGTMSLHVELRRHRAAHIAFWIALYCLL